MVLVDLGIAPVGDLVGLAVSRDQGVALLALENHQRLASRGPVDAQPGDVAAPAPGLFPDIVQIAEFATIEEAPPGVGHAPLPLGLVPEHDPHWSRLR